MHRYRYLLKFLACPMPRNRTILGQAPKAKDDDNDLTWFSIAKQWLCHRNSVFSQKWSLKQSLLISSRVEYKQIWPWAGRADRMLRIMRICRVIVRLHHIRASHTFNRLWAWNSTSWLLSNLYCSNNKVLDWIYWWSSMKALEANMTSRSWRKEPSTYSHFNAKCS